MHHRRVDSSIAAAVALVCFAVHVGFASAATPSGDAISQETSIASYQHYLEDLLYTHLGDNRGFGAEHDLARGNILATFRSLDVDVALEPFLYNNATYYNVVATQIGRELPDEIIVVGAHFDSVNNPGADDNGTGTALVMEVARVLSQHRSARTLKYILFDREEQGRVGSIAYVNTHAGDDIVMAVTADMVGHDSGAYGMDLYGRTTSAAVVNGVAAAIDDYGDSLNRFINLGNYSFSDHWSFESAGIPSVVIIERCFSCNTNYHTLNDAVDVYPDYITYPMIADLLRSVTGYLVDEASVALWGDYDANGRVDLEDSAVLHDCLAGPGFSPDPTLPDVTAQSCLVVFDRDDDGDIDLRDAAAFDQLFNN